MMRTTRTRSGFPGSPQHRRLPRPNQRLLLHPTSDRRRVRARTPRPRSASAVRAFSPYLTHLCLHRSPARPPQTRRSRRPRARRTLPHRPGWTPTIAPCRSSSPRRPSRCVTSPTAVGPAQPRVGRAWNEGAVAAVSRVPVASAGSMVRLRLLEFGEQF